MTKFFTRGTSLAGFEQIMMSVPNFSPRGRGMYVFRNFLEESRKVHYRCPIISDFDIGILQEGKNVFYEELIEECFDSIHYGAFKRRLRQLILGFDGEFFLDEKHKERFLLACFFKGIHMEDKSPEFIASLFLLTSDDLL